MASACHRPPSTEEAVRASQTSAAEARAGTALLVLAEIPWVKHTCQKALSAYHTLPLCLMRGGGISAVSK